MKRKLIITTLMLIATIFIITPKSNAVLNSNGGTPMITQPVNWILPIRQLETLNGGLGLKETIDGNTLLSISGSNNIDVHMQKNTEYGAMAILTVSSYGNPNIVKSNETSTGNKTGVVYGSLSSYNINGGTLYGEAVAARGIKADTTTFGRANLKYINIYGEIKIGDALAETSGWQNSSTRNYRELDDSRSFFRAGHSKSSIFEVYSHFKSHSQGFSNCRAAVVCGEGI